MLRSYFASLPSVASRQSWLYPGLLLLLVLLTGCSKPQELSRAGRGLAAPIDRTNPARQLAREHSIVIDTAPDRIATVYAAGLDACRNAASGVCTLLASNIDRGADARATMTFRARPDVIPALVAALGNGAELVRQSTAVEDLTGPIADTTRRQAMLADYRKRLEDLRRRAGDDIDALIKVNRELAEVQTGLEEADGKRAALAQRVDTDILNVSIRSERHRPFWSPIAQALEDFGGNLAQGISTAISGLAYLIPWLLMLVAVGWAMLRLWRRRSAKKLQNAPDKRST